MRLMQLEDPKNMISDFVGKRKFFFALQMNPAENTPNWKNISEDN